MDNEQEQDFQAPEEPIGTDQVKNSKVFTQAEVDKIVRERLEREKATTRKVQTELDEYRTSSSNQVGQYEEIIQKIVDAKLVGLPDNLKGLLGKLPLLEQFAYLSDEKNLPSRKQIPATPKETEGVQDTKPQKKLKLF